MRDKNNADAQLLQGADLAKQPIGFAGRKRGGGFIEDQDLASRIRPRRISTIC
jgi:hypothetical protein